jgi:hypothetical protein
MGLRSYRSRHQHLGLNLPGISIFKPSARHFRILLVDLKTVV